MLIQLQIMRIVGLWCLILKFCVTTNTQRLLLLIKYICSIRQSIAHLLLLWKSSFVRYWTRASVAIAFETLAWLWVRGRTRWKYQWVFCHREHHAVHGFVLLPTIIHPAWIMHDTCLRSILLVSQYHILQILSQVIDWNHWSICITQQLLPQIFILKNWETPLKLTDISFGFFKIVEHVLVTPLVEDVVFFWVQHLGPLFVLVALPRLHSGTPIFKTFGNLILERNVPNIFQQVRLH